jgi:hypothetical protein
MKPKRIISAVSLPSSAATPATTSSSCGTNPSNPNPSINICSIGLRAPMIICVAAMMITNPNVALRVPLMV